MTVQSIKAGKLYSHLEYITATPLERTMLAINKLVIRRRNLWDDAMEKISIFFPESDNTSGVTLIDVQFLGEEGLDGGGVKREFFCKIFEKSVHKLMAGGENMLTFR